MASIVEINRTLNEWRLSCAHQCGFVATIYFHSKSFENQRQQFSVWSAFKIQTVVGLTMSHVWRLLRSPSARPKLEQMFENFPLSAAKNEKQMDLVRWRFYGQTKISATNASVFLLLFLSVLFESTQLVRDKQICCFCFGIVSLS